MTDNLVEKSISSDHAAVRIFIQKPLSFCDTVKRTPSWMVKHPVFCTILKQISDGHQYADEQFAALADLKLIIAKARKRTHHELLRNTPGSPSAKFIDWCYCHVGVQEQTTGHIDALLSSLGKSRPMLRPMLF